MNLSFNEFWQMDTPPQSRYRIFLSLKKLSPPSSQSILIPHHWLLSIICLLRFIFSRISHQKKKISIFCFFFSQRNFFLRFTSVVFSVVYSFLLLNSLMFTFDGYIMIFSLYKLSQFINHFFYIWISVYQETSPLLRLRQCYGLFPPRNCIVLASVCWSLIQLCSSVCFCLAWAESRGTRCLLSMWVFSYFSVICWEDKSECILGICILLIICPSLY